MTRVPTYSSYGDDDGAPPPGKRRSSGLAIGSLVCGIIALFFAWIPVLNFLAVVLALAALVMGIVGRIRASEDPRQRPTVATIGVVVAVLAIIVFIVSWAVVFVYGPGWTHKATIYGAQQRAAIMEREARGRGVDEQTLAAARQELEATFDALPADAAHLGQVPQDVEDALHRFRDRLAAAPGSDAPTTGASEGGKAEKPE